MDFSPDISMQASATNVTATKRAGMRERLNRSLELDRENLHCSGKATRKRQQLGCKPAVVFACQIERFSSGWNHGTDPATL